jgi:hypothetical protein
MAGPWAAVGRYGAVGLELVVAVVVTGALGYWLDARYWGSRGWGVAAGLLLGFAAGMRNLMRAARQMQADIEREEARDPLAGRWTVDESWVHDGTSQAPPGRGRSEGGKDDKGSTDDSSGDT